MDYVKTKQFVDGLNEAGVKVALSTMIRCIQRKVFSEDYLIGLAVVRPHSKGENVNPYYLDMQLKSKDPIYRTPVLVLGDIDTVATVTLRKKLAPLAAAAFAECAGKMAAA